MNMVIKFNSKIYPENVLKRAILDYAKIADIIVTKEGIYNFAKIRGVKQKEVSVVIKDEFANYVLGLTKKCL